MGGSRDEDLFKQMETNAKRSRRLGNRMRLSKMHAHLTQSWELRGVADNEARGPKANGATKTID